MAIFQKPDGTEELVGSPSHLKMIADRLSYESVGHLGLELPMEYRIPQVYR